MAAILDPSDDPLESSISTLDRRNNVRTAPVCTVTALWVERCRQILVDVVDESKTGLGIRIPANASFQLGPDVYIDYQGVRRKAAVAHLNRLADDSYRLGVCWSPDTD